MKLHVTNSIAQTWGTFLLAALLAGLLFLAQGRSGLGLADEGFLWYGAQHTAQGEVPLRDFQSYDPGRYYWCAAGTLFFGKGLVALRFAETLFQVFGLWAGLLAARRLTRSWPLLLAIGLMLTVWMFPSHKLFDHSLLLIGIWVAVQMIENPTRRSVFMAGCFLGLCVFFGRNHAVYNLIAQGALLLLLRFKEPTELPFARFAQWGAGVLVGLIPIAVMLLFVPGFFAAYWESIESIFRHGTNLSVPIPWPWRVSYAGPVLALTSNVFRGVLFLALPIGYASAIGYCLSLRAATLREHPVFVACAFVGMPYVHHAFSRADFSHLAQSIHPFTLGLLAALTLLGARQRYLYAAVSLLIAIALIGPGRQMPVYQRLTSSAPWEPFDAGGTVYIPPQTRRLGNCLRRFSRENLRPDETLLIAPFTPGWYSLLDRPAPLWDLSFYFPAAKSRQERMIETLTAKNVNWAILSEDTIDGRDDLRFSATHQLVYRHLSENFESVASPCLPRALKILRRKQPLVPNPDAGVTPAEAPSLAPALPVAQRPRLRSSRG